jgi:transcription-repair coupling factor (superfamily II helicase)
LEVVLRTDFIVTREAEYSPGSSQAVALATPPVSAAARNRRGWIPANSPPGLASGRGDTEARVSEKAPAFLPGSYIAEAQPRIQAYRRLAEVNSQEQLDNLRKIWRDRFGPLPDAAENLLVMTEIKLAAGARKITQVEAREGKLILTRGGDYVQIDGKFPRLTAMGAGERLREMLAMLRSL